MERLLLVCPITPRVPGEWAQELPRSEELVYPPGIPRLEELRREGIDERDPVAFCRAWFTWFLLPAQMGDTSALVRFPLDDVCSFPNEWPQHAISVYFDHILPKMGDWDFRPRLPELSVPMLVMQGTDDLVPEEASREWAAHAPDARFLRIEGLGAPPLPGAPQGVLPRGRCLPPGGVAAGGRGDQGGVRRIAVSLAVRASSPTGRSDRR